MAGKDNLKTPSSAEARSNGRKGGIASGEKRREKKAMKETLETLLQMPLKSGKAVDLEGIKSILTDPVVVKYYMADVKQA